MEMLLEMEGEETLECKTWNTRQRTREALASRMRRIGKSLLYCKYQGCMGMIYSLCRRGGRVKPDTDQYSWGYGEADTDQ